MFTVLEQSIIIQGNVRGVRRLNSIETNGLRTVCHVLLKIAGFHSAARGRETERAGEEGGGGSNVPFRWDIAGDGFFCNIFEGHIEPGLLLPRDHLCQASSDNERILDDRYGRVL